SLQQVGDNTFLNELTVDGRRTYFRDIEVVAIEGHADAADPVEQTGNLDRGARSGGRIGDLLHKSAVCIQEIQGAVVKRSGRQGNALKDGALSAAGAIQNAIQHQRAASDAWGEDETVNGRGVSGRVRNIDDLLPRPVWLRGRGLSREKGLVGLETIGQ